MKNKYVVVIVALVILVAGLFVFKHKSDISESDSTDAVIENDSQAVYLSIVNGESIASYEYEYQPEMTAFSVLENASTENDFEIIKTDYDFGVFVSGINGVENTDDLVWIYYVNGASGDVAADEKEVDAGDLVEWKFVEPIF